MLVAEVRMTFRAVVVDIGGVLERNPPTGWVQRWEQRLGMSPGELAAVVSPIWHEGRVGHASLETIERRTAVALDLDARSSAQLWDDVWTEHLGVLDEELLDYVSGLRPRFKTAILSSSFVGATEREQERYGLQDHFDAVVHGGEPFDARVTARPRRASGRVLVELCQAPDLHRRTLTKRDGDQYRRARQARWGSAM